MTPGPWEVQAVPLGYAIVPAGGGPAIALVITEFEGKRPRPEKEDAENAEVLAAAPRLLRLLLELEAVCAAPSGPDNIRKHWMYEIQAAEADATCARTERLGPELVTAALRDLRSTWSYPSRFPGRVLACGCEVGATEAGDRHCGEHPA